MLGVNRALSTHETPAGSVVLTIKEEVQTHLNKFCSLRERETDETEVGDLNNEESSCSLSAPVCV